IRVQLLQRVGLRAEKPVAEDVVVIAPDADDLPAAGGHGEPAGGFAQGAGAEGDAIVAGCRRWCRHGRPSAPRITSAPNHARRSGRPGKPSAPVPTWNAVAPAERHVRISSRSDPAAA